MNPIRCGHPALPSWLLTLALLLLASLPARAQRVLVFPLEQEGGSPATEWIGTGLAVALDETLSVDRIASVPYEELRRYYDQENLVAKPAFSRASKVSLAKQLGAGVLVEGTFKVQGDQVETRLQALDLSKDLRRLGSWTGREALSDLPGLTRRLVDDLLTAMGKTVLPMEAVDPGAFESYIRGRIAEDLTLQEVYFRRAIEIAPAYDNARCHLAMVLRDKGQLAESRAILESLETKHYAKAYLGLLLLAEIRLSQGRLADARKLLHASLKAREGAEAHLALAQVNLREKKYADAERELVMAEQFGSQGDEIDSLRQEIQADQGAGTQGAGK
jgi:tetratricopeptide (TPR) repeat protein